MAFFTLSRTDCHLCKDVVCVILLNRGRESNEMMIGNLKVGFHLGKRSRRSLFKMDGDSESCSEVDIGAGW